MVDMLDSTGDGDAGSLVNESFEGLLVSMRKRKMVMDLHFLLLCC